MRLGVLGTGRVGSTIAGKLIQLGHEVMMGSRDAANEKAQSWARGAGERASCGAFADAAAFGETVINCTAGAASLDALEAAGAANLNGKVLIDISNPLDVSKGMPPSLTVCNNDSLGEQIQRAFPEAKVVKTLNTVNHQLMVDPSKVPGDHHVFVSGDDEGAKASVVDLLGSFGWPKDRVIDLGDLDCPGTRDVPAALAQADDQGKLRPAFQHSSVVGSASSLRYGPTLWPQDRPPPARRRRRTTP